jgi:hypothetical protein
MKTLLSLLVMALLVLSVTPGILAVNVGTGITPEINTEDFAPLVWLCDREVADDLVEPQLYDAPRFNNYAFEGESITWEVLVMDKNGKEKISDVFATIGDVQGDGNDIEANCVRKNTQVSPFEQCEATILEEHVQWNSDLMAVYECQLTVETPDSMYGEFWATVEAEDMDGLTGTMAQNEYWFLNPTIALSIDGDLVFDDVRPGSVARSSTLLVGNDADDGSGVLLDMYISGSDFYDSSSSGAMCPVTNQLSLAQFTYDVVNGQFQSTDQAIRWGDNIFQAGRMMDGVLFGDATANGANFLAPGAEMSVTFQLDLPEPCNGDFDTGDIFFWGEAI